MNDKILKHIHALSKVKSLFSYNNYLDKLEKDFYSLKRKAQRIFIKELRNTVMYDFQIHFMNYIFLEKYYVVKKDKAFNYLLSTQLIKVHNPDDLSEIIHNLRYFSNNFIERETGSIIREKQIAKAIELISSKYPNFSNILKRIKLNIILLKVGDKKYNSTTAYAQNFTSFDIYCYYMKNNEEYQNNKLNPVYVFLHEMGHIINWLITKEDNVLPDDFLENAIMFRGLTNDNPDALEVFADSFAMSVLYNTEYEKYDPFSSITKKDHMLLEKYFFKKINEIKDQMFVK